uniref:Uncharacterized protein n=1 Tax=Arundo donax TaxID=35708 RepID=A0A0A9CE49_ARUDO
MTEFARSATGYTNSVTLKQISQSFQ